ncbi:hypothetical protein PoB_000381600 [Plakobranchus ocellatus]|uniref:Uncharacterized protein n=1 Tax=Plakobranchus ocellatus TaxID=259542 RepID=A0AAV3Y2E1_9GAST|nr:hypothetical protein PoB_000381600 [Plakobranchus ocellatus]
MFTNQLQAHSEGDIENKKKRVEEGLNSPVVPNKFELKSSVHFPVSCESERQGAATFDEMRIYDLLFRFHDEDIMTYSRFPI